MADVLSWRMTKRYFFPHHPLFKLKQNSQNSIIVHFPSAKRINFYDLDLNYSNRFLAFSKEMQAIELMHIEGRQYLFAGLKTGALEGRPMTCDEGQQEISIQLGLAQEMGNNIYINDMLNLGEGRLMNCYNSGKVAIWKVEQAVDQSAPLALVQVHEDFVYKLRRVDKERAVTCGNDQYAHIIDLEHAQVSQSYYHPDSVWCSYPVDRNLLCSAGIFGSLFFHDLRANRMVQTMELQASQTSFVTHLDANHLIFGDGRLISRCDLRKVVRERHCQEYGMNISAESILVTAQGGIVVGRGGDMALFASGGEPIVPQVRKLKYDNSNFSVISFLNDIMAVQPPNPPNPPNPLNPDMEEEQWSDESDDSDEELI